jgi:hypothetical protein
MDLANGLRLNVTPVHDGEINTYVYWADPASTYRSGGPSGVPNWFNASRRVVFINGMLNSGEAHAMSAMALSEMQQCPVVGIHNRTGGFIRDLGQCIADKWKFHGKIPWILVDTSYGGLVNHFDQYYNVARRMAPSLTRVQAMEAVLSANLAAVVAFRFIMADHQRWPIFAHSQGNLILSNALTACAILKGQNFIDGRRVYSYGSPARNWPDGIVLSEFGFSFDPVTWLQATFNFRISKVGVPETGYKAFLTQPISHSFNAYLNSDPEFVINRYRWGGLRMTFVMDEAGLAAAIFDMGDNEPRIYRIFERLRDAHQSDFDDVALEYVKRLQNEPGQKTITSLRRSKRLIDLLIEGLDLGFTPADEQSAIRFLRGERATRAGE